MWKLKANLSHSPRSDEGNASIFFERMEPRILFSADALSGLVSGDPFSDLDSANTGLNIHESASLLNELYAPAANESGNLIPATESHSLQLDALQVALGGEGSINDGSTSLDTLSSLLDGNEIEEENRQEIIFVDAATPEYQQLLDGVNTDSPDTDYQIFILQSDLDGIEQITDILNGFNDIDAVHLLSHGNETGLQLGNSWLGQASLDDYADAIGSWSAALSEDADLLIYGCNLAADESGQQLISSLAELTAADVAASDDLTGATALNGDWELEYVVGELEHDVAFSNGVQQSWSDVLGVITVTTTADDLDGDADTSSLAALVLNPGADGEISVREAIKAAETDIGSDTILLQTGTYTMSSFGFGDDTGDFDIRDDLSIVGVSPSASVIDGADFYRIFEIHGDAAINVSFQDLTLLDGSTGAGGPNGGALSINDGLFTPTVTVSNVWFSSNEANSGGSGGAIYNEGNLTITNSLIEGNTATDGAGIAHANGTLTLTNVTVSGNTASNVGGGLNSESGATITNSTFTLNDANDGGGIRVQSGTLSILNTISAGNTGTSGHNDVLGTFNSLGYNLIGDTTGSASFTDGVNGDQVGTNVSPLDPMLGGLADNGGPTLTHALLPGSVAINAGIASAVIDDQRGVLRDATPDIGAFEFVATSNAPVFQSSGPYNIDEGATATTVVGDVDADDGDGGAVDVGIIYSISTNVNPDGDGNNAFVINSSNGEITVNDTDDLDFEAGSSHIIAVEAFDGAETVTTNVTININDVAPKLWASGSDIIKVGQAYTLDLTAVEPGVAGITTYTVNWGDGNITTEAYTGPTTQVSHIYTNVGFTYNITFAANDVNDTWTSSDLIVGNWITGGDVFIFDGESGNPDGVFDPTGGAVDQPYSPVVGPDGNFYVSGYNSNNIVSFAADGTYLGVFSADALLNEPTGLAWGSDGNLYVANYGGGNILQISPDTGNVIVWGAGGGLNGPDDLAFGPDGDLYVTDWDNDLLVKFDGASGGVPITVINSGLNNPEQIVFDAAGDLFIANGGNNEVARWDGVALTTYFTHPDLTRTTGLAFGPDGQLYVSSYDNDKILRYDGVTGEVFADDGLGGLEQPEHLTFTPDQQVTVVGNYAPSISVPSDVFINELHYDNTGIDTGEAIELLGAAGTDLTGWSLVLYSNGNGDRAYYTEFLSGTIADQSNGYGTLAINFPVDGIQNGISDGIALVNPKGQVIQFISYEGALIAADGPAAGLTSIDIGVAESDTTPVGSSLQLTGTGSKMTWVSESASTFGALNTGQNIFAVDSGFEDTDNVYTHAQMLATLGASDLDDADANLTVNITNVVNGTLTMVGGTGEFGTTFIFTPNPEFSGQLTFDYEVLDDDSAASAIGNGIINIVAVDDPINVNTTGNTVNFTEDSGATAALFSAGIDTIETGDTISQLVLTLANVEAGDTLVFGVASIDLNSNGANGPDAAGFTYTVSSAGASPVVTISHAGTDDATVNTMLNSLVFNNTTNNDPSTTARTVTLTSVTDSGSGTTADGTVATVNITAVNDAPTISTSTYDLGSIDEDTTLTGVQVSTIVSSLSAGDPDGDAVGMAVTTASGNGTWQFSIDSTDGSDGNWTSFGSVATNSALLLSDSSWVRYQPDGDNGENVDIDFHAWDGTTGSASTTGSPSTADPVGGGGITAFSSNIADASLVVTYLNDAPGALNLTSTSTYNEGDVSVAIDDIIVTDVDNTENVGVTLTLNDTTIGSLSSNDGAVYNAVNGEWTIFGTLSAVNNALANLVFNPNVDNDQDTTISVEIDDGDEDSSAPLTGTITLDVTPIDDAIDINTTGNTVSFTEEGGATAALFIASIDTIETSDTISQLVLTLANVDTGDTLAFGATSIDLNSNGATGPDAAGFIYTVSSAGASPVVTISHAGSDDATVNTMLNSLVFNNPTNNDPSTTARTVTLTSVTDSGSGLTADGTIATVNVTAVNDGPSITSTAPTTATEDTLYTYTATVTDVDDANDGTNLTWSLSGEPAGMTVSNTGVVSWTPANGVTSSGAVTLTVQDGGEDGAVAATEIFTITVTAVNDAPTITSTAPTTATEDTLYTYTPTVVDVDDANDGTNLIWSLSGEPAGMTVSSTGVVSWAPANGVTSSGAVTLTVQDGGEDGAAAASEVFTIAVTAVNDAPTITSTAVITATEDSAYSYTFAVSDVDTGDTLTLSAPALPAWMSFNTVTGELTGTPTNAEVGTHNVVLRVNDGTVDVDQSFTITVSNINDAPTGTTLVVVATEETATAIDISGNVADVDGTVDLSTTTVTGGPSNGSLINNGDGTFSYTGNTNFVGSDSFTYTVEDNGGQVSSDISVTINVSDVNDAPTATNLNSTSSYNEGDSSVALNDIVITDIDNAETVTATLTLANTSAGSLSSNNGASYDATTGIWTVSGSVANVNMALANVTFTPAATDNLNTTVAVSIEDGDEDSSGPLIGALTITAIPTSVVDDLIIEISADETVIETEPDVVEGVVDEPVAEPDIVEATASEPVDEEDVLPISTSGRASSLESSATDTQDFFFQVENKKNNSSQVEVSSNQKTIEPVQVQLREWLSSFDNALNFIDTESFIMKLNDLREEQVLEKEQTDKVAGVSLSFSAGLSVGYVVWLTRSGVLLSSVLSSLPAWQLIDPLPVLASLQRGKDDDDDEESLESIVKDKESDQDADTVVDEK